MSDHTWQEFLAFLYELPVRLKPGRQRIAMVRDGLQELVDVRVRPGLTKDDEARLFPLGFSPAESNLKIAAGVGLERGLISPKDDEEAIRKDKEASPFGFLQTMSGKTLGETATPLIVSFWLVDEGDHFAKMSNRQMYDLDWTPHEIGQRIRIELKASSEENPNFQQIRSPRLGSVGLSDLDYDFLLCLGLSNDGLEWWTFPAKDVELVIASGIFAPQHGGAKMESGTYWVRMTSAERNRLESFARSSEAIRDSVLRLWEGR